MGDPPPSIISTGAHFSSCNFILEISSRLRENWFVVGAIIKVMEVIYSWNDLWNSRNETNR